LIQTSSTSKTRTQSSLPKRQRLIADGSPLDLQRRAGAGALDVLQVPVLAL